MDKAELAVLEKMSDSELEKMAYPDRPNRLVPESGTLELEAKALFFLRDCKPKEYRRLKKSGELLEAVLEKSAGARAEAKSLHKGGEEWPDAWNRAVRSVILESPDSE